VLSVPVRTSFWKIWLSASNCWRCTSNDLAVDSRLGTRCFGSCCEGCGLDGKRLSFSSHPEPLWIGIGLAFGCIGHGSQERDGQEVESR
jgi:hypothetical protein